MLSLEGAGGILQKEEAFLPHPSVLLFGVFPYSDFRVDVYGDDQCLSAPIACPEHAVPQENHDPMASLWPLHCVPSDMGTVPDGFCAAPPADQLLRPWLPLRVQPPALSSCRAWFLQCPVLQGAAFSVPCFCRVPFFWCWVPSDHHFLSTGFLQGVIFFFLSFFSTPLLQWATPCNVQWPAVASSQQPALATPPVNF